MAFKGLFVGIDRYASPDVNWLNCAVRDATALHALFEDNFAGQTTLLGDDQANRTNILCRLEELAFCDRDDLVVICFSGHGTETHELVPYDLDPSDFEGSAISLIELGDICARIPANRLLVVLDCCFAGGMGAKALEVEGQARDVLSVEAKLDRISGHGRVILTAANPTERAWENQRIGHGFLTYYLLEALLGPEEIRTGNQISVFKLLQHVVQSVTNAARSIQRFQNPAIRGTFNDDYTWPVLEKGPLYNASFPEFTGATATTDLSSLKYFGFPDDLIASWAAEIPALNQLQVDAINDFGVLRSGHLIASAPTSSGKTMLGELAAIKGVAERKRAIFLLPMKALVSDKLRQFKRVYGPYGIRTVEATGETNDISPLLKGQYDIALLTYEKFASLALTFPQVLEGAGTIVIDEVQMIADLSRGANLEFILTLIKMRRAYGIEPQLIALSAVIGATNGLEGWLNGRLLRREERPVPLNEGVLRSNGDFRYIESSSREERIEPGFIRPQLGEGKNRDWVIPLVHRLVGEGKQIIMFRETVGETFHGADYLAASLGLPAATSALSELPTGDPSLSSQRLRNALSRGIAFHNSNLSPDERRVIEEAFRRTDSDLRVIVATTTLAMGVNTPAAAVVIVGLDHPGANGSVPYSVAEYKNIVGRAGRLGFTERGESFLIATTPKEEYGQWNRYVTQSPEDLESRFMEADPRTMILRVLVATERSGGVSATEVIEFLEASFGFYQLRTRHGVSQWDDSALQAALFDLTSRGLIENASDGLLHLRPLGRLAGYAAMEVESVVRTIDRLRDLRPAEITEPALITTTQTVVEVDSLNFPINRRGKAKELSQWVTELRRQGVASNILLQLGRDQGGDDAREALRAKKAVACLHYVAGTAMDEIEGTMKQFGGGFDGCAGNLRSLASRTCDFLPSVGRIAELLHPSLSLGGRIQKLVLRLEMGIEGAAVELAVRAGNLLDRADYKQLCLEGLNTIDALGAVDDLVLLKALSGNAAKLRSLRRVIADWQAEPQPIRPVVLPQFSV